MAPRHSEQDIETCPVCGGQGGWYRFTDDENEIESDDYVVCSRCQGSGQIMVTIRKLPIEDER